MAPKEMSKYSLLQWNCRGLRANFDEFHLLTTTNPTIVCLQETYIKQTDKFNFRNFDHFSCPSPPAVDGRATGGTSILVKNNIPHSKININTTFQAVAIRVTLHKPITICSIYLPPRSHWTTRELSQLIQQLPPPIMLMGDFNAHNTLWGDKNIDSNGIKIEDLLMYENLCLLNTKTPTYLHPATGSQTAIDLSICDPSLLLDFSWQVGDDLCGSDHFPIFIEYNKRCDHINGQRWKLGKADWTRFQSLCTEKLLANHCMDMEEPITLFTSNLHSIAESTIPKTSPYFNTAHVYH
jgi:exonuclease III